MAVGMKYKQIWETVTCFFAPVARPTPGTVLSPAKTGQTKLAPRAGKRQNAGGSISF